MKTVYLGDHKLAKEFLGAHPRGTSLHSRLEKVRWTAEFYVNCRLLHPHGGYIKLARKNILQVLYATKATIFYKFRLNNEHFSFECLVILLQPRL